MSLCTWFNYFIWVKAFNSFMVFSLLLVTGYILHSVICQSTLGRTLLLASANEAIFVLKLITRDISRIMIQSQISKIKKSVTKNSKKCLHHSSFSKQIALQARNYVMSCNAFLTFYNTYLNMQIPLIELPK